MPRLFYKDHKFGAEALDIIRTANTIVADYAAQGFSLTLRQLYYQFVARGYIPNTDRSYKRLGSIINDARMGGLIDWYSIEDRTRNLRSVAHWKTPSEVIDSAASGYRIDKWMSQPNYVEVWIEKDALLGVIEPTCRRLDVPYFSCRGYTSQSEMWGAAQRIGDRIEIRQKVTVLHLGDHDPSGIDMSRDITDRIWNFVAVDRLRMEPVGQAEESAEDVAEFVDEHFKLNRLALNMDQVDQYSPPPNPAKITDSRAQGYIAEHGRESWELDALEPTVLAALVTNNVEDLRDQDLWDAAVEREDEARGFLARIATEWDDVEEWMRTRGN